MKMVHIDCVANDLKAWLQTFKNFSGFSGFHYKFSRLRVSKTIQTAAKDKVSTKNTRTEWNYCQ
jgi:hypothetical protein